MTIKPVTERIGTLGKKTDDQIRRDLVTLVNDLNERLLDLQAQITVLKNRIDSAGIP